MKTTGSVVVLLLAMAAVEAQAQEGPSFNCRYAGTATELAICRSPDLARLERRLVQSYEGLVQRIGQADARATADSYLALRQACEGDAACIESQLTSATLAFEGAGTDATPDLDEASRSVAAVAEALRDREPNRDAASATAGASAALDEVPRPLGRPVGNAFALSDGAGLSAVVQSDVSPSGPPEDLEGGVDPTPAMAGPDPDSGAAATMPSPSPGSGLDAAPVEADSFPSALTGAFMTLPADRRASLQGRLVQAGLGRIDPDGTWTVATAAALATAVTESMRYGRTFNPSTREGATALLDFIGSDGFEQDFLGQYAGAESEP